MHISIATEHITVQKIPKKLLSKCPAEFAFFSPDAYVPGVHGIPLPLFYFYVGSASPSLGPKRQDSAESLDDKIAVLPAKCGLRDHRDFKRCFCAVRKR